MVAPAEILEDCYTNNEHLELLSPTSINEVLELKESMSNIEYPINLKTNIEQSNEQHSERFVCLTDCLGNIKYTNFMKNLKPDNILRALGINCNQISKLLAEIAQNNVPINNKIETIVNGHICLVTINQIKTPVILKLQLAMNSDVFSDNFIIWMFKKASIVPATIDYVGRFKIDEESEEYFKFAKLNLVLAIDQNGSIVSTPKELIRYLQGENFIYSPRRLGELIDVTEEMSNVFEEHKSADCYRRFSASSLDLSVEDFNSFQIIFTTKTSLKDPLKTPISVNIFNAFNSKSKGLVFPVQIKYEASTNLDERGVLAEPQIPEFQGFTLLRMLSESIHSTIYEAMKVFQPESRVIIKLLNSQADETGTNPEVKFYKFYSANQIQCQYIERPIKIEELPRNVIYMNAVDKRVDLFEYIQSNPPLPDDAIKTIFSQLAKSIGYLHEHRIIHRDIKDENVLIELSSLKVTLIDFGSSVFLDDGNFDNDHYAGTIAYAPIEVLKGHSFNGPEQDIWCLGIVLYILCFKELPFHSPKEILQGILRLPIERSTECIQLIRLMLDPNPKIRPSIKEVLDSDFLS